MKRRNTPSSNWGLIATLLFLSVLRWFTKSLRHPNPSALQYALVGVLVVAAVAAAIHAIRLDREEGRLQAEVPYSEAPD